MFTERLEKYRNELNLNKREMANRLGVAEGNYNLFESGKREPSKNFIFKLVEDSLKPEEYWRYGIENPEEYIDARTELKSIKKAIETLIDLNMIGNASDLFKDFKGSAAEELLVAAMRTDLQHKIEKNK